MLSASLNKTFPFLSSLRERERDHSFNEYRKICQSDDVFLFVFLVFSEICIKRCGVGGKMDMHNCTCVCEKPWAGETCGMSQEEKG